MAQFSLPHVKIAGIGASIPSYKVSNKDYQWLSEKDGQNFMKMTGIVERRIAPPEMCASDLCVAAAEKLLSELGWDAADIEVLVVVTQTPDYIYPGASMGIQERLGIPKTCMSFDINQGCAGYVYGLSTISGLISSSKLKKGLLLVGDTITHTINEKDKVSAPIFSDAGSATALEWKEDAPLMHFNLFTDGSGSDVIYIPEGGGRTPMTAETLEEKEIEPGVIRAGNQMAMRGLDVFNFGLREVAPCVKGLLDYAEKSNEDADYFIFHQANMFMNEAVRKKLKVEKEKVPYTLSKFGNTSCATIPVTITSELQAQLAAGSTKLVLTGFGVGLSWGSAWIELEDVCCPELLEIS